MIVAVSGASGFLGRAVCEHLRKSGHEVRPVSLRRPLPKDALLGCGGVVHLAGEQVIQPWTEAALKRIRESRVEATQRLVEAMRAKPPQVMVSASGVGYYGSRGDDVLLESEPAGSDFLAKLAEEWEREAVAAESLGVRVTRLRIGMVLGRGGGALQRMVTPFRLGLGGRLGDGRQWISWIHIQDFVQMVEFLLKESTVRGVFNAVSPHPARNAEFTQALAGALHRPALIPVPRMVLKIAVGGATEVVLSSQRALPDAITRAGFTFRYPDLYGALAEIYG